MRTDEAFSTFDWDQKILPQEYRKSQKKYFGKRGMSVFIGSFVLQNDSPSPTVNTPTSTTSAACTISTQSFIIAITNATQTGVDTLNAGEFILQ